MSDHATPSKPRWNTGDELRTPDRRVAFNLGDRDEFAQDARRGWWYWTSAVPGDRDRFRGPFRTQKLADRDRRVWRPQMYQARRG